MTLTELFYVFELKHHEVYEINEEHQNKEKEDEIDLVTQKSVLEIAQQSPSYLHIQRDNRSPVFV